MKGAFGWRILTEAYNVPWISAHSIAETATTVHLTRSMSERMSPTRLRNSVRIVSHSQQNTDLSA